MKFVWLTPQILEVRFEKSFDLCDATYRFSHFYETPGWQGIYATRKILDDHYSAKFGDPDYWKKRWAGSNVPGVVFDIFKARENDPLSPAEQLIMDEVKDKTGKYYVIMTSEQSLYARDHEIAHALWYTDPEYKRDALAALVNNMPHLGRPLEYLAKIGYSNDVLTDELHVYCGVYYPFYLAKHDVKVPVPLTEYLCNLYSRTLEGING